MSALVPLLLLLQVLNACYCQTTGDLRLVNQIKDHDSHTIMGRLEIFWEGKWGTFCNINSVGADVACKQMGFQSSSHYQHHRDADDVTRKLVPKANSSTPKNIGNTFCGYDNRMLSPIHILRCGYSTQAKSCTHDDDIILSCAYKISRPPTYTSQIRLVSGFYPFNSSGTMEVYNIHIGSWGNVCYSGFDRWIADSACRQMGYTHAEHYNSTKDKASDTDVVWLDGVKCGGSESCECLNNCFQWLEWPDPYKTNCPTGYVTIKCGFDVKRAKDFNTSSGGWDLCQDSNICKLEFAHAESEVGLPVLVVYGVSAGAAVIIIILIVLVLCFAVPSCPLARNKKKGYEHN